MLLNQPPIRPVTLLVGWAAIEVLSSGAAEDSFATLLAERSVPTRMPDAGETLAVEVDWLLGDREVFRDGLTALDLSSLSRPSIFDVLRRSPKRLLVLLLLDATDLVSTCSGWSSEAISLLAHSVRSS